jgi:hypothetical protein
VPLQHSHPIQARLGAKVADEGLVHFPFAVSPRSTVSGQAEWLRSLAQARIVFPSRVSRP